MTKKLFEGIIICAIFFGIMLFMKRCYDNYMNDRKVENVEQKQNKPVTHYTDVNGVDHAEKPVVGADVTYINAFYQHIIDSLTKVIKAKPKDIKTIVAAGIEAKGSFEPEIEYVTLDTCVNQYPDTLRYRDKWMSLMGSIRDKKFNYIVADSLTFVMYQKKTGLFKKELYLNAYSQNPNVYIKGLTGIQVPQPNPRRFGIGVQVGYTWDGKWQPYAGVGLSYNLIRF